MRRVCIIGSLLLVSSVLIACGGSSEAAGQLRKVTGTPNPPQVRVPSGPAPSNVVVEDLRKGQGVVLKEGDWFTVNYIAVAYRTGERREAHWEKSGGFTWRYGKGKIVKGWVQGLRGMRVGERRELVVPSKLAYHSGALVYVVELIEVR